jgi:hypothetical protein
MAEGRTGGWEWRKQAGGPAFGKRVFHAFGEDGYAACRSYYRLVEADAERAHEGSELCEDCITVVREHPDGRA